jgi:gas vesicle protein
LESPIEILIGIILGAIAGYVAAYLKKKAQNRALLEDVRRLEEEKRSVEKKFVVEVEQVKKEHNLEIEHRKYQYEDKRKVYSDFCNDLDKYQSQGQVIFKERMMPMMTRLLESIEDSDGSTKSVEVSFSDYFSEMLLLCNDLNLAFVEVKNQTNKLRLSTSDEAESLLNDLLINLEQTKDLSTDFMQYLATPNGMNDKDKQTELTNILTELGLQNEIIRTSLIKQMKNELQNI